MKKLSVILWLMFVGFSVSGQELNSVVYQDGDQRLKGMVTSNTDQNRPGVLILPAWQGIDQEAKDAALNLQKEGYTVFIADIYGEGNIPEDTEAAAKIAGHYKKDHKAYQHRIELGIDQLKEHGVPADKIAVIGYCFGGTGALEAARAGFPVQGVVSIHGGLDKSPDRPNQELDTKILVENPAEDKSVTDEIYADFVQELRDGNADWQIITYANTGHTFTNPDSDEYDEVMAKRAWNHTLLFLEEVLKEGM